MKTMLQRVLLVLVVVLSAVGAWGQEYAPKAGETIMKVAIEGRGNLYIKLFTAEAPKTTNHIMGLVRRNFYDGQRIFRVDRSPKPFLLQMGAPGSRTKSMDDPTLLTEGTGAKIPFEDSGFLHDQAGRVGLSAQPGDRNSGDAQFHILLGPSRFLDGNYTVFGQVVGGLALLSKIEKGDRIVSVTLMGG
ncbi:MAG: peptidylprolyl isomerase [Methanoregulaceae archaeon]|nr:peptidylprolyl isomerase [Methanoregulaceae archaeon]